MVNGLDVTTLNRGSRPKRYSLFINDVILWSKANHDDLLSLVQELLLKVRKSLEGLVCFGIQQRPFGSIFTLKQPLRAN